MAGVATHPQKSIFQAAAVEVILELPLDIARQRPAMPGHVDDERRAVLLLTALHLQVSAKAVPKRCHALVVIDGVGWHGPPPPGGLDSLTLLKLPPASPEFNSVEQPWRQLR